jgi:hypothetical protein
MSHDAVIDEVRATRDAIAREHDYDLDSIFRMLRTREATSERLHVTFPPRPWPVATSEEFDDAAQRQALISDGPVGG